VYESADVFVVLHEVIADRLHGDFGVAGDRIVVAPIALEPEPPSDSPALARGEHDRDAPVTFLFFGSLRRDKGLAVLLEAAARLTGNPAVDVLVAGAGDAELEHHVRAATESGAIRSELGWVPADRKAELFRAADVVVLPYDQPERFQSQSAVLADAYAHRRPLLATDVGAIGPTIRSDASGWIVPAGDVGALASTMAEIAADPTVLARARAAIDTALQQHSYDAYGRRLREAYLKARRLRGCAND
jgi:glycosyltransferase involved in cell wall biosynthesis